MQGRIQRFPRLQQLFAQLIVRAAQVLFAVLPAFQLGQAVDGLRILAGIHQVQGFAEPGIHGAVRAVAEIPQLLKRFRSLQIPAFLDHPVRQGITDLQHAVIRIQVSGDGCKQFQGAFVIPRLLQFHSRQIEAIHQQEPCGLIIQRIAQDKAGRFVIARFHGLTAHLLHAFKGFFQSIPEAADPVKHFLRPGIIPLLHHKAGRLVQTGRRLAVRIQVIPGQQIVFRSRFIILLFKVLVRQAVIGLLQADAGLFKAAVQLCQQADGRLIIPRFQRLQAGKIQAHHGLAGRILIPAQGQELFPGGGILPFLHPGRGYLVYSAAAQKRGVLVIAQAVAQFHDAFILLGSGKQLRTKVAGFPRLIGTVLVIPQAVKGILRRTQRRQGTGSHGLSRLAIGAFLSQLGAFIVKTDIQQIHIQAQRIDTDRQADHPLLGSQILKPRTGSGIYAVLHLPGSGIEPIERNAMEGNAERQDQDQQRTYDRQRDPAGDAAAAKTGSLRLFRPLLGKGTFLTFLFLTGILLLEDHGLHRGLVKACKYIPLAAAAAAARILPGGVGPSADTPPHRSLIAGEPHGIRPCQRTQHLQPLTGRQRIGYEFRPAAGCMAPYGAILKPYLFHGKIHAGSIQAVLDIHRHLKGAARPAIQPLHPFHLPGQKHTFAVVAGKNGLHADDRLLRHVKQLQAAERVLFFRQGIMPELYRASQIDLHSMFLQGGRFTLQQGEGHDP